MWTGFTPWENEFPFPGSLISTFPEGSPQNWLARKARQHSIESEPDIESQFDRENQLRGLTGNSLESCCSARTDLTSAEGGGGVSVCYGIIVIVEKSIV